MSVTLNPGVHTGAQPTPYPILSCWLPCLWDTGVIDTACAAEGMVD